MGINFDMLAQETLRLSETLAVQGELPWGDLEENEPEEDIVLPLEEEEEISEASTLSGPGVVFYFDQGVSTYCLKGIASEDLEWEQELLTRKDPKFLQQFRLKEDWNQEQFLFYPTESTIDAEIIADHILGKRFPKQESILCNLSDPGFSWWLREGENDIEIFYQSQMIERDSRLVQLGPLGDSMLAARRFSSSLSMVKELFVVNEFSSTDKSFHVSSLRPCDQAFHTFKNIFLKGEYFLNQDFATMTAGQRSFYLFMREVALLRRFWLYIEGLL